MYQKIICNRDTAPVRHETLEGRNYLVVPTVMLTEGVHAGSNGNIYYPPDEMKKSAPVWNHKPIVVYHPEMNGKGVSACDPLILSTRKVGLILNTNYDGKLRNESWLDEERCNVVDSRIMDAITKNEKVEVSTGLFMDADTVAGEWNGEKYDRIARNFRPDHLAILPDQKGACSIADGAGLLQLNSAQRYSDVVWKGLRYISDSLLRNAQSFSAVTRSLSEAIRERFGKKSGVDGSIDYNMYIEEVYDSYVIYYHKDKCYRIDYAIMGEEVKLSDAQPVEVERVISYQEVKPITKNEELEVGNTWTLTSLRAAKQSITRNGYQMPVPSGAKKKDRKKVAEALRKSMK